MMKNRLFHFLLVGVTILTACGKKVKEDPIPGTVNFLYGEKPLTPINYDFDNLGLYLNSSITDPNSKVDWNWNYLKATKSWTDSTGIDYFMDIDQPNFSALGQNSQPALYVTTYKNKIIAFSAAIVFYFYKDEPEENVENLIDSLTTFDLLKDETIKQTVKDKHIFRRTNADFTESIEIELDEDGNGRAYYRIKNRP